MVPLRLVPIALGLAVLAGCGALADFQPVEPACDQRRPFWPDDDGDGFGDTDDVVYVGCFPPEGWVSVPPFPDDTGSPTDTSEEPDDSGATDSGPDSAADSGTTDSGASDSGSGDSGASDSGNDSGTSP